MKRPTDRRLLAGGALFAALIAFVGLAVTVGPLSGSASRTSSPATSTLVAASADRSDSGGSQSSVASVASGSGVTATPSDSGTVATLPPTASPRATATPISPQLPSLLGAIGDSYSQAYNTTPAELRDHPEHSWVVGTAKSDGVFSIRERLEALGARLTVVDAATSGKKMADAPRQARLIVAAAGSLKAGQTALVTFELGTNDLCDDPKTTPASFQADLGSAVQILRDGLPSGSRILMVSVPDFAHFRNITQANPAAKAALALYKNSRRCAPFLGDDSPTNLTDAESFLSRYDSILVSACDQIQTTDGATGKLFCRSNRADLADGDFLIGDLSTVDYFHPSLAGQGKMAAAAWDAGFWGTIQFTTSAAAAGPTLAGLPPAGLPLAGLPPAWLGFVPLTTLGARVVRRRPARPAAATL